MEKRVAQKPNNFVFLMKTLFFSDEENEKTVHSPKTLVPSTQKKSKAVSRQSWLLEENIENTIFVGNLPNTINHKDLTKLFRKFGKILNSRFRCAIRKELKIPKKLAVIKQEFHDDSKHINAYVKFFSFDSCKAALKMNGEIYQGHHLRVTLASDERKSDPKKSIFVGNLAFSK